jgi:2-methylcitrate dehydratase PrpD
MPNAAETFAAHVAGTQFADIPSHAIARAKVFILDTLGVGIAGSSAQGSAELLASARLWGAGSDAAVWGRSDRMPAHAAAFLNAFAVHCQESMTASTNPLCCIRWRHCCLRPLLMLNGAAVSAAGT